MECVTPGDTRGVSFGGAGVSLLACAVLGVLAGSVGVRPCNVTSSVEISPPPLLLSTLGCFSIADRKIPGKITFFKMKKQPEFYTEHPPHAGHVSYSRERPCLL